MRKRILVTGNKGFIGSNLFNTLQETQEKIHIIGIDSEIFEYGDKEWSYELIKELNNFDPDVVFHLGACSDTLETDVNFMMTRNFESTGIISDWCNINGSQLIYSSSAANYGENELYPSNLYGWSKYAAEQYVISNNGVALRYFNVYGPGESHKGKMASVAYQMYMKNLKGEEIKLFTQKPKRDFIYVKDVVDANIHAMNNYESLKGHYYDVGSGEANLFETVMENMEIPFSYHEDNVEPKGYQYFTCSNKLVWMPNWTPKYTLETGIKEYKKFLDDSISNR